MVNFCMRHLPYLPQCNYGHFDRQIFEENYLGQNLYSETLVHDFLFKLVKSANFFFLLQITFVFNYNLFIF